MKALTVLLAMPRCPAYAALYGKVQHKLFADVAAGESAVSKKSEYIEKHGIPARMFNAVRITLDGKVSAVRAAQRLRVDSLERRIAQAERQVARRGTGSVAAGSREAASAGQPAVQISRLGNRHWCGPGQAVLRVEAAVA